MGTAQAAASAELGLVFRERRAQRERLVRQVEDARREFETVRVTCEMERKRCQDVVARLSTMEEAAPGTAKTAIEAGSKQRCDRACSPVLAPCDERIIELEVQRESQRARQRRLVEEIQRLQEARHEEG